MLDDLPDLLEPIPRVRVDLGSLERAVDLAFAAGGTETALDDCLDRATRAKTSWDPSSFERDVFVADLVRVCMPIVIGGRSYAPHQGHLRALLSGPPADLGTIGFRQLVLRELRDTAKYRRALESLLVDLRDLKRLLGPPELGEELERNRRRVDALAAVRRIFDGMATGFEGATSGLARLARFGKRVASSEAFARMTQLLDFEGKMAAVDVRLELGHDGSLRTFDIVRSTEDSENPYYRSPFRRFWQRLFRFFRGYRFSEDQVLEELIDRVFEPLESDVAQLFPLAGDVELYLAALGFADLAKKKGLAVCVPDVVPAPEPGHEAARELVDVFNPLLFGEHKSPVPCTLRFARHDAIVVFSGPNSGGKTRLLQAIAIAQMMGQAGLFVPASSATLVFAEGLFVSLIQEAKADQREGRLGMELLRIRDVFERLRPGGVVMLDELCSGTNPSEGEEIFELVVSLLAELGPQAFITTHFLDFAARLEKRGAGAAKLEFLQVELDDDEEPTYQFVPGVAKTSLARKTAARLGVTRDELEKLVARSQRLHRRARAKLAEIENVDDPSEDDAPTDEAIADAESAPGERQAEPADRRGAGRAEG